MFKAVPHNPHLKASLAGDVIRILENGAEETVLDLTVEVMFGKVTKPMDRLWVGRLAHYELELPVLDIHLTFGIRFEKINQKLINSVADVIPVFPRPVYAFPGYRIIPTNCQYAITDDGEVFDLKANELLEEYYPPREPLYPTITIYDPDKGCNKTCLLHRLVAFAWIANDDYVERFQINHKDGVKTNCKLSNLEWVSQSENSHHAFKTGLREDNIPCKIRSAKTGEVQHLHSLGEVQRLLSLATIMDVIHFLDIRTKHKLLKGEFELKREEDETSWFYEKHQLGTKSGRYHIQLTHPDGRVEEIPDVRTFKSAYKVWNVSKIEDVVAKAQKLYPDIQITYTDNYKLQAVQAKCVETGEIVEAEGIRPLCRLIEEGFNAVRDTLQSGRHILPSGKWIVRYKTLEPWPAFKDLERQVTHTGVAATHTESNEVKNFHSLRETAAHFGVDRSLIKVRIRKGTLWNGWAFSKVSGF